VTPSRLREKVIAERTEWIEKMLSGLRELPFESYEKFIKDPVTAAAAESYLRRALEALLDMGRHVLAKGFGKAVAEYKLISTELEAAAVLPSGTAKTLRILAGYRNRMVHFYHEISSRELYEICTKEMDDIEKVLRELLAWINDHPEMIDREI
jgi:uncharacterized protein YutE (UPF0331/DUF86 family)